MADMESNLTVLLCILDIRKILKEAIKSSWLFFMIRTFFKANSLFKTTRWAKMKNKEAKFVKSILILAALYLKLKKKMNTEKAMEVMKEIVIRISSSIDYSIARKSLLFTIPDPFERWIRYRSGLITEGFGLYNDIEDVYISWERIHYVVKRCIFHDAFVAAGTPELTHLICDYDQTFHNTLFKEYYFDRNGSIYNAIGHGAEICHYVWKHREILTHEFKEYLKQKKNPPADKESDGVEKRSNVRRQYERRQKERRKYGRRKGGRRKEDSDDSGQEKGH
ncbi:MAG: L-2-amino-thiazoline-4-carboxylic acid hydrolase [Spirochaetales bacterium]|nr:L-2-amino-thiazoline-4-carboxylic acid hydrolase [Spirochaetales bacterium]